MPFRHDSKWFGWGRRDKSFDLRARSAFWSFLGNALGGLGSSPPLRSLDDVSIRPSRLSRDALRLLTDVVGEDNLSTETRDRVVHSLGKSYPDLIRLRRGEVANPTDTVVFPADEAEIEALLRPARQHHWVGPTSASLNSTRSKREPSITDRSSGR